MQATRLVDLTQVGNSILWTSVAGSVSTVKTLGWPASDGGNELGGALMIERPADGLVGTINIGEAPMSVSFEVAG